MKPSHVICKDFLSEMDNAAIYLEALSAKDGYVQSKIYKNESGTQVEVSTRKSFVNKNAGIMAKRLILDKVKNALPDVLSQLEIPSFEVDHYEMQLTTHNDGHFYKPHVDNGSPQNARRVLTFIYYFHSEPKVFSGGELLILMNPPAIIQPLNNSIVFFDSSLLHSVHPVQCPGARFEDGRFTLNGWVWRK